MNDLIQALKDKKIKGVEDVRACSGFCLTGNDASHINCFDIKMDGKWNPLLDPHFETRKEVLKEVREIKKYWKEKK